MMFDDSGDGNDHHVPLALILRRLGISELQLNEDRVEVSADGLRLLLSEFARRERFDEIFYVSTYKDVKAALLSGDVACPADHYAVAGFFEGRLPRKLEFDPAWYYRHYSDLAKTFSPDDRESLTRHFLESGVKEGRAGLEENLLDAERWR